MSKPASFEWDGAKAASNAAKHGIRFEVAVRVFDDPIRVDLADDRKDYGEARRITLGIVQGLVLYVAYTMRGRAARIISARLAHDTEEDAYNGKVDTRKKLKARFQRGGTPRAEGKKE